MNLSSIIEKNAVEYFPDISRKMIRRYAEKYVSIILLHIKQGLEWEMAYRDGRLLISSNAIKTEVGQMKINGKALWIYHEFRKHEQLQLFSVIRRGNSIYQELTEITINPIYKEIIMNEIENLRIAYAENCRLNESHYNYLVPVNKASLKSYITRTKQQLDEYEKNDAYREKLRRCCDAAILVDTLIFQKDGMDVFPEKREQISSGRWKAVGINTLNIPVQVRKAMLGKTYQYDLRVSAYSLLTAFALHIDPTLRYDTIMRYIKHRKYYRTKLAEKLDMKDSTKDPELIAKEIFASIGFGARVSTSTYTAIGKLLHDKANVLREWDFWQDFKAEWNTIKEVCWKVIQHPDFQLDPKFPYTDITPTGEKRNKNSALAWLYQSLETVTMDDVISMIPKEIDILTRVHDCVYTKEPIPLDDLVEIKMMLHKNTHGILTIDYEMVLPIHGTDWNPFAENQQFEAAHKRHLQLEEMAAKMKIPVYTKTDNIIPTEPLPITTDDMLARFGKKHEPLLPSTSSEPYSTADMLARFGALNS